MLGKLNAKFRNLKEGYKRAGLSYLIQAIMWRLPSWLLYYDHSLLFGADEPKIIARKHADYIVRQANLNDIDSIDKLDIYPKGKTAKRFKMGDFCHIVLKGEEVVSIIWAKLGKMFAIQAGAIIDTGDDGFFLDGMHTVTHERLKGLHMIVYKSLFDHMASLGRHHILGIIKAENTISILTHQRMNFKIVGETFYFVLLGVSICYYKKWPYKTRKIHIFFKRPPENLDWV
jgi:hypothetical protein